jgi:hypothetical protein
MKNMRPAGFVFFALLTAGCTNGARPIDAGKPADMHGIAVTPQSFWTQFGSSSDVVWTQDGAGLDELHFYIGVKDGQPLFPVPGAGKDDIGKYRSTMLPNDVEDLFVATLGKTRFKNVRAERLRPCPYGTATGFCFELSFANGDDLEMRGRVLAAKLPDRLDILFFLAPSEYYFDTVSASADQVFSSIQIK